MQRKVKGPNFIAIEIIRVIKYFNQLLHVSLIITILFHEDLSVFQIKVMFGGR